MKYAKQTRMGFIVLLILAVPLFLLPSQISPAHAADSPAPQYTFKAINQTILTGYSTGGSYLDTYYDDASYHTLTGRMIRVWDPDYGRLIYYLLDVVYTFSVNSTGIPIPPNFMNITRVEVNGKAHTDESSAETVHLYILNCRTGGWQNIGGFPGSTIDQFLNWTTTNSCNDYIATNGDMKLKWQFAAQDFEQLALNYQCIKLDIAAHKYKWTFMVYLDSDWHMEAPGGEQEGVYLMPWPPPIIIPGEWFGYQEMNEMETVGSTNDVAIVVQIDRYDGEADRYLITKDTNTSTISSPVLQTLGEVNMADPATLTDFINWTNFWYPTDHLLLVLHDHGQGFLGTCKDETSDDVMSMTELKSALYNAKTAIGKKIDVIGFVACLMQMTEVAYQIRDYGKVLVASEEVMYAAMGPNAEINVGWPFDTILANLTATPSMDETTLAKVIIDRLKDLFYQHTDYIDIPPTISAVDSNQVDTLAQRLDTLSGLLINKLNDTLKTFIQNCRTHAQQFYFTPYIDLYNFTKALCTYADPEIQQAANTIMTSINNTVIYEWHWPNCSSINPSIYPPIDAHGVSIYFPWTSSTYTTYRATYEGLDISTNYRWDDFLRAYYGIT